MKAYTVQRYGIPDQVLTLVEVERPVPKPAEVLVQVCATTINDYDWCITTGKPFAYRLFFGLFRPKKKIKGPGNGGCRNCGKGWGQGYQV